ncbi:MHYT domain-containing protein, partial [Staphylococcus sp. SIMBA_130]
MGMAIAGMHYVGLEAATFYMAQYHNPLTNGLDTSALSIVIAIGTLCVQTILIFGIVTERKFIKQET